MSIRPTAGDFNALFRGAVFGNYDIFSARSYADFVRRNDVDRAAAVTRYEGTAMIGALAYGVRGERAWFGLIGVDPARRREGIARAMMVEAIDAVHRRGVTRIELEISQRNLPTLAFVEGFGFEQCGELLVWARPPRAGNPSRLPLRRYSEHAVATIARAPYACWQREPRSVALAARFAHIGVPGAYAFVRAGAEFANVLDAGAADELSAAALARMLDTHVAQDLTLNNEPAGSPLCAALRDAGWRIVERQHRMVHGVRPG